MLSREPSIIHRSRGSNAPAFQPLESRTLFSGTGLAAAYFAKTNLTAVKFSRVDSSINFQWAGGTPSSTLGTDGFSTRWTGYVTPKFSEVHTFIVSSAGGVRVWVNNTLIIDHWSNHTLTTDTGKMKLTGGGKYEIRVDYWSDGHSPQIKLEWQSARTARAVVPTNRLAADKLDKVAPTQPTSLKTSNATENAVTLSWKASSDPSVVIAYDVFRGSTMIGTTGPKATSFIGDGLSAGTGYTFSVQAIDAAGNLSKSSTIGVTTAAAPRNAAPSRPGDVHVTGTTNTTISLAWNASSDDHGVSSYRVYRDGVKLGVAPVGTSFTDSQLLPGTSYTYLVRAVDGDGVFSATSVAVQGTTNQPVQTSAFGTISAANYTSASGVSKSGSDLQNLDDGDWASYDSVNFGSGANSVSINLALPSTNRGGRVELHLDSLDGATIGQINVQPTGSFTTYREQAINITETSGTHTLFVEFKGRSGVANFRSMQFSSVHLTQIMALGDSITQQSVDSPSYRYYLWQMLQGIGYNANFVGSQTQPWDGADPPSLDFDQDHEGHAGYHASDIVNNITNWATANVPDVVLLHIGTNDIRAGEGVDSTISEIGEIIDLLRAVNPNVRIYVAQVIPLLGHESDISLFNAAIPGLANDKSTSQSPVTAVDMNSEYPSDGLEPDGIHPNSTGDQFMAQQWYNALIGG